jgi:hypothetical protein
MSRYVAASCGLGVTATGACKPATFRTYAQNVALLT